jgi:hypothetical protein
VTFDGSAWLSIANSNSGNYPNASGSTSWVALTGGTSYMSLINLNINNNPANAPALWASGTSYSTGNKVGGSDGQIYTSPSNSNLGHNPVTHGGVHWSPTGGLNPWTTVFTQGGGNQQWLQIGGSSFPAGRRDDAGYRLSAWLRAVLADTDPRNAYRLSAGYQRPAPQAPKAGVVSYLGFPDNRMQDDWTYEGNYIVTWQAEPIVYRFVADVVDVTTFDDMFCEALACSIAMAVVEPLTQSNAKLTDIAAEYRLRRNKAITVNPARNRGEPVRAGYWPSLRSARAARRPETDTARWKPAATFPGMSTAHRTAAGTASAGSRVTPARATFRRCRT